MNVDVNMAPPPAPHTSKRRRWTTLLPRPGSSSGRPSSSSSSIGRNGRPFSNNGWLGGDGHSLTLAGFKRSPSDEFKTKEPILATTVEDKEMFISRSPTSETAPTASANTAVPTPSWTTFIPRPGSSSGRQNSTSSPVKRNGRPSSSSGWLGGGGGPSFTLAGFKRSPSEGFKTKEPILATTVEGKEMNISSSPTSEAPPTVFDNTTTPTSNRTTFIPRPGSSSDKPNSSSSPVKRNGRPSSSSGWLGGGGSSFTLAGFKRSPSDGFKAKETIVPISATTMKDKMNVPRSPTSETSPTVPANTTVPTSSWTTFTPGPDSRPRYSSSSVGRKGRPSSSSGWLGGGGHSLTLAGFRRSPSDGIKTKEAVVPILPTTVEGKEMNISRSPTSETPPTVSANATVPTFIPEPDGSARRPRYNSSPVDRNGRPSSSSGWLGGGGPSLSFSGFKRPSSSGSKTKEATVPILATPVEDKEMNISSPPTSKTPPVVSAITAVPTSSMPKLAVDTSCTLPYDNPSSSPSHPTSPKSPSLLTVLKFPQAPDHQASQLPSNAAARAGSFKSPEQSKSAGSFGKSLTSMMGGLSSLSLSRTNTRETYVDDKELRGRSAGKIKRPKSASQASVDQDKLFNPSTSRARSQSPFSLRRFRTREPSPTPQALPLGQSDAEMSDTASSVHLRATAFTDDDSGDEVVGTEETEYGSSSDEDNFDFITERNTERNALTPHAPVDPAVAVEIEDNDPVGEGVNVIVAPEPYFPSSLNTLGSMSRGKRNPRRRKSVKAHEPLPFQTSRPIFQRDRCTITITQGDPEGKLGTRRKRQYVVASDLSQESRYAVEWGIGTVVRDSDEMLIVTVVESDSKVDPPIPNAADRATKLRSQQERQGLAYILVRQVTGLLQRTKLNVRVSCQAWHAKNSRHMLLDIVDHVDPTMLIVGSRGLGQLNGILLGSTSHYLIQKCSVPVMVARRRLKRPPKKSAHLATRHAHVSLAEAAGIDRVAARVDQDVQVMRDEIQKDVKRRIERRGSRDDGRFDNLNAGDLGEEDDPEYENDDDLVGVKVAGD